jgi:hypothetical protein
MGAWLSWSERAVHIREVIGSSPIAPTSLLAQEGHESPLRSFSAVLCLRILIGRQ